MRYDNAFGSRVQDNLQLNLSEIHDPENSFERSQGWRHDTGKPTV